MKMFVEVHPEIINNMLLLVFGSYSAGYPLELGSLGHDRTSDVLYHFCLSTVEAEDAVVCGINFMQRHGIDL